MDLSDSREIETAGDLTTVGAISAAEINQQILIARQNPRSVANFIREATALVSIDQSVAAQCVYAVKRGADTIQGPSARLAEIVVNTWGNCRAGARVVAENANFVTAQGVFYDLQKNVGITFEVQRRITNRKGERFNDDMIGVTGNAASSIALRNAVFKGVPKAYWASVYERARQVIVGDFRTMSERVNEMAKALAMYGITAPVICAKLGRNGLIEITADDLITLVGIRNAIADGETTPERAFALDDSDDRSRGAGEKPAAAFVEPRAKAAPAANVAPSAAHSAPTDAAPVSPAPKSEPAAPAPDLPPLSGKLASAGMVKTLRMKIDASGIPEKSMCEKFGIESLEAMDNALVNPAFEWISAINAGPGA